MFSLKMNTSLSFSNKSIRHISIVIEYFILHWIFKYNQISRLSRSDVSIEFRKNYLSLFFLGLESDKEQELIEADSAENET